MLKHDGTRMPFYGIHQVPYYRQLVVMSNYDKLSPTGNQTVTFCTESNRDMIYSMLLAEGFKCNQDNDELIDIITKK